MKRTQGLAPIRQTGHSDEPDSRRGVRDMSRRAAISDQCEKHGQTPILFLAFSPGHHQGAPHSTWRARAVKTSHARWCRLGISNQSLIPCPDAVGCVNTVEPAEQEDFASKEFRRLNQRSGVSPPLRDASNAALTKTKSSERIPDQESQSRVRVSGRGLSSASPARAAKEPARWPVRIRAVNRSPCRAR